VHATPPETFPYFSYYVGEDRLTLHRGVTKEDANKFDVPRGQCKTFGIKAGPVVYKQLRINWQGL
jgi:hypothetical protein